MHIESIAVTPVKGLGLNHPAAVDVTATGVPGDRRFAVVDAEGRMVNGKQLGELVRVHALWNETPETLVLVFPDGARVGGEVRLGGDVAAVFHGKVRPSRLVLGDYAQALSDAFGRDLRLVQVPDTGAIDRPGVGSVSLQSAAALLALAHAMGERDAVDGRRFRMTFTLAGAGAHAEDAWIGRRVRIGGAVVVPEGHVGRCVVTTQNPDTGLSDLDTLKTIAQYRGDAPTTAKLAFGVHGRVVVPGRVAVGDAVEMLDVLDTV